MKIYTRRGDSGETSLFGGRRVRKSNSRIEAYGTVDELNSYIGLVRSYQISDHGEIVLDKVQQHLFVAGTELATPGDSNKNIQHLGDEEINWLEKQIDALEEELPALKNFILPGGGTVGATLNVCRTVCRRAERICVRYLDEEKISSGVIRYLNRLSDLLFVLARYENKQAGYPEKIWKGLNSDKQ